MIPVLSSAQVKKVDTYTIENEPVASIDLMERASQAFVHKLMELDPTEQPVQVFAGTGNNGGDALAIARLLIKSGRQVAVYTVGNLEKASADFQVNRTRLQEQNEIRHIDTEAAIPTMEEQALIIDGLFGSGLSRPVTGLYAAVIDAMNKSKAFTFAIDIPSGLFADSPPGDGAIVAADHTISFQTPKLAFFQPSLHPFTGRWHVVDIGLNQTAIDSMVTDYFLTESGDVSFPQRSRYAHKGSAGRMLLVSGSRGKMGSTTLSARAAMRSGCGLLYVHTPQCGTSILQVSIPEAIVIEDEHKGIITGIRPEANLNAIAIGPGIGTDPLTKKALLRLLEKVNKPVVLDADALNILSENTELISLVPRQSILTPHPGEFKRLVGEWEDDFQKLNRLQTFCRKNQFNVVLKGAFSAVCNTQGEIFFNPTGNPGMATAGSGDVLTGILGALLGQGFSPEDALKTGVYLHGLAADMAVSVVGEIAMVASDIITHLPAALLKNVNKRP